MLGSVPRCLDSSHSHQHTESRGVNQPGTERAWFLWTCLSHYVPYPTMWFLAAYGDEPKNIVQAKFERVSRACLRLPHAFSSRDVCKKLNMLRSLLVCSIAQRNFFLLGCCVFIAKETEFSVIFKYKLCLRCFS